jgi:predicted nucleic acid-binding protein
VTFVVDASVAVKWILPESGSSAAAALRKLNNDLSAPSLIAVEVGNALWRAVRRGSVTRSEALEGFEAALISLQSLIPIEELRVRALTLAIELRHPIYDCFYLALAQRENALLVTADEVMFTAARKAKIKARRI